MDTTPFYELRNRLYLAAAAGCAAINEDFRLKRAIEDFQPISQANKAFARLYTMCANLFSTDNTSAELASCIAMADALAVTLGSHSVPIENKEEICGIVSNQKNIPYSRVKAFKDKLAKLKSSIPDFEEAEASLLTDPRIAAEFIRLSYIKREQLEEFADAMFMLHGDRLIPLLKRSIDMTDSRATGMEIYYISRYAGERENEWYLSLAGNEELPVNVRVKAIEALACSSENSERLIELYQTEKSKPKAAALLALAKLSPPEAEPIFKKITGSYKDSKREVVTASRGAVCTAFASEYVTNIEDNDVIGRVSMLANKTDIEDVLLKIADKGSGYESGVRTLEEATNNMLVSNLGRNPEPEYRQLIHRLYNKNPDFFFQSELVLQLLETPDKAVVDLNYQASRLRELSFEILSKITYSPLLGKYYMRYAVGAELGAVGVIPHYWDSAIVFDSIPESIVDFLLEDNVRNGFMGVSNWHDRSMNKSVEERAEKYYHQLSNILQKMIQYRWSEADSERYREKIGAFAIGLARKYPNTSVLRLVGEYYRNGSPEDYMGVLSDCIIGELERNDTFSGYHFYPYEYFNRFPISETAKRSEVKKLEERLKQVGGKYKETAVRLQLGYIKTYIDKLNRKEN